MPENTVILAQKLVKHYGPVQALQGLDLEVKAGEIFGFLGPNGAGKTTTIRCMLDLIRPDGGSLEVLGINPQKDPVAVRSRLGYLPGELRLEDGLSIEATLRYYSSLRPGKVEWTYVQSLAERLGLDLRQPVQHLSKGNKQKVGVLQAFMHRPELLLLDEPTSGLDPLVQQEVLGLIKEQQKQGVTIFFSSHVLSEVQETAGRVGIIRKGVVVEVAETSTLMARSLRRARVHFNQPVDAAILGRVPGVSVMAGDGSVHVTLQVSGEMDALIKTLAGFPVRDIEIEHPSLEEIFLAYYKNDGKEG
jgi:ABC-2 type transport system ATP-binding protein